MLELLEMSIREKTLQEETTAKKKELRSTTTLEIIDFSSGLKKTSEISRNKNKK